jgi:peptide/nickel transport system permease protein
LGLRGYIAKRIVYSLFLMIMVMALNYIIFMVMPGDPVSMFINPVKRGNVTEVAEQTAKLKEMWGLSDPPVIRFFKYVKNMFTWNFGITFSSKIPVAEEMMRRLPYTLGLMGVSTVLAIVFGVVLGAVAAHRRGGKFDAVSVLTSLIFYSLPTFWMGMLFILIFYVDLGWFPHAFAYPPEWAIRWPVPFTASSSSFSQLGVIMTINPNGLWENIMGYAAHAFLPVLTLTLFQYGGYLLLVRATMVEALTEDYIVTARAKGVSETNVVFRHALKNASLPLITSAAISFGFLLSGAIITEGVYSWPGLGRWIFDAIGLKDYNILQAVFYIIALCVIIANFIADLLYGVIDPRIKY